MSTVEHFPAEFNPDSPCVEDSGKLSVLHCLLSSFKDAQERVVLVSNYTQVYFYGLSVVNSKICIIIRCFYFDILKVY